MRLIDADALIEAIEADMKHIENPLSRMFMEANISDIRHMPTIEPERKRGDAVPVVHGRWIGGELGHCSVCGHEGCASDIWDGCKGKLFCPNCGAVLEDGKDGNNDARRLD